MGKNMYVVVRECVSDDVVTTSLTGASMDEQEANEEAERLNRLARKREELNNYRVETVPMIIRSSSSHVCER